MYKTKWIIKQIVSLYKRLLCYKQIIQLIYDDVTIQSRV